MLLLCLLVPVAPDLLGYARLSSPTANTIAQAAYRSVGFDGYQLDPSLGKALFWEKKLA